MKKFTYGVVGVVAAIAIAGCAPTETETENAGEETAADEVVEAEPTEPVSFTMDELSCWDLTTSEEDTQAFAATLVYGYVAGAAGQNEQSSDAITAAIGSAMEFCANNPDATAIEAFSQSDE